MLKFNNWHVTLRKVTLQSNQPLVVYLFLSQLISLLSALRGHVWEHKVAIKAILQDRCNFNFALEVKIKA